MKLDNYDVFGFDMDLTLATYNITELFRSSYLGFAGYLVNKCGYDASLLDNVDTYINFTNKGLIVDLVKGNVVKLDAEGHIIRCSHGTRMCSQQEITSLYGKDHKLDEFDRISATMESNAKYLVCDNYFVSMAVVVFARVVDLLDKKNGGVALKTYDIWPHLKSALDASYFHKHFADNTSLYFRNLREHPEKCYEKCSAKFLTWLKNLKHKHGKIVFLLSSSFVDYASFTASCVIGPDWRDYFDLALTYARKPTFFTGNNSFYTIENNEEKEKVHTLHQNELYSQGHVKELMTFLQTATGKQQPKVVFFGDSLRSDVISSKNIAKWDVVLISPELEAEGQGQRRVNDQVDEHEESNEPTVKRMKRQTTQHYSSHDIDAISSPQWGSCFHDNLSPCQRRMNTMYGAAIERNCDLVLPHISFITDFSLSEEISQLFYPQPPTSLNEVSQNCPHGAGISTPNL